MNIDLNWSEARNQNTARGPRSLQVAEPTPDFWQAWRMDKEALKSEGISVRKQDGEWQVCRWSDPVADSAPAPAPATEAAPVQEGRPARTIFGFQPMELDSSRVWSDEQHAIFNFFRSGTGNLEVQARAGTGKTTTIKIAFSQAPEEQMLYAVFNKKNQLEAQAEISDPRVEIKTLHALGYKFIRSIWSNSKPDDLVETERCMLACGNDAPDDAVNMVKRLVGFVKNTCVAPSLEDVMDIADERQIECPELEGMGWTVRRLSTMALRVLELSKSRDGQGRISFNDMVWLPVAKGWVQPSFDLVCIDEAQDMNLPQLLMAEGACRPGGRVIVVGDDRQAIYGFRGAASDGMKMMQIRLQAKVLGLTITYRCPKSVVEIASAIVPDYKAAPSAPQGVVRNVSGESLYKSLQVGDAVLSRANAPLMPICLHLLRIGTPARIEGRDIGKQLAGLVRKMNARSVPQFITKVENWAAKQKARFAKSKHAESKCSLIEDQAATLVAVAEGISSVAEIEPRLIALFQDTDGNSRPAVVLSSVHKAKGLEWNRVHLVSKTFKVGATEGEESNIYYVAVTRAKQELIYINEN